MWHASASASLKNQMASFSGTRNPGTQFHCDPGICIPNFASQRQSTRGPQLYESQRIRTTSQNDYRPGPSQPCHCQFQYNSPVITEPPQHAFYQVQHQEKPQLLKNHQSLFESVSSDGTTIQQCPSPVPFYFDDSSDSSSHECFGQLMPDTEQDSSDESEHYQHSEHTMHAPLSVYIPGLQLSPRDSESAGQAESRPESPASPCTPLASLCRALISFQKEADQQTEFCSLQTSTLCAPTREKIEEDLRILEDGIRAYTELFSRSPLHQHPTTVLQENHQVEPKTSEDDGTEAVWWDIPTMSDRPISDTIVLPFPTNYFAKCLEFADDDHPTILYSSDNVLEQKCKTDSLRAKTKPRFFFPPAQLHPHRTMVLQENHSRWQCEPEANEDEMWWDIPAMPDRRISDSKFLYSEANAELYMHSSTSSHGSLSETCSSVLFQEAMESDAEAGTQCSPLTKATLASSFSASSFTDCDVEFSASISSPHLARLDYPISSHSPQALLSPVFRKCFTDSINPTFVTCCISSIGPSARLLWEGDWLTVGSHGSM
jgi:hypothetical protein